MKAKPSRPAPIVIPRTQLDGQLELAAQIKRDMAGLLLELEAEVLPPATAAQNAKPGGWRHDPLSWSKKLI